MLEYLTVIRNCKVTYILSYFFEKYTSHKPRTPSPTSELRLLWASTWQDRANGPLFFYPQQHPAQRRASCAHGHPRPWISAPSNPLLTATLQSPLRTRYAYRHRAVPVGKGPKQVLEVAQGYVDR